MRDKAYSKNGVRGPEGVGVQRRRRNGGWRRDGPHHAGEKVGPAESGSYGTTTERTWTERPPWERRMLYMPGAGRNSVPRGTRWLPTPIEPTSRLNTRRPARSKTSRSAGSSEERVNATETRPRAGLGRKPTRPNPGPSSSPTGSGLTTYATA